MDPTAMRQWLPSTVRPSLRVTTTLSPTRSTLSARDFDSTVMPPRLKTRSRTAAASVSSPGRTWSRLEMSVTLAPRFMYAEANSAPVTPEPTTMRCSGKRLHVVELGPGEDPLAVRAGGIQLAGR